ncbi:hypothetical protein P344_03800 [Spiroplasma mirum ATCC 29335]|uniref:Uncharacterized protein n=1 Tax=Spiroplasma mirum ATCC 29335 TaxID=838561 RepID=W0GLD5_9MOLU|nr:MULTISPECIES: hypothetical protein [Spiroplasma]AHF61065.1 hypothetical protein SMM_0643 [Spiroplasma mirum ATCC 29335]AHI58099.1 hypothetical protein P344_03800 [Spiroplasma mirum ATCC 29335]AKM53162.1 hypothetical protein SATRI_v1c07040 [Spiroplasma atrichopogonis]
MQKLSIVATQNIKRGFFWMLIPLILSCIGTLAQVGVQISSTVIQQKQQKLLQQHQTAQLQQQAKVNHELQMINNFLLT